MGAGERGAGAEDEAKDRLRYGFWAVAVPAALYSLTVFPGPGGRFGVGDAFKFQYIGRILGVPHEPGYPQYVVLNYLWSHVPIPVPLATRVAILSAVFALVAGILLYATARRVSGSGPAAMLATWIVLLSVDVWGVATQAEVYSLNMAWVGAVLLTAWMWRSTGDRKWLVVLMACYALSFGNHLLMIVMLPALLLLVVATDISVLRSPRMLLAGAAAVAVGVSQYAFLWWRSYHEHETMLPRFPREAGFFEILDWSRGSRFTARHFFPEGAGVWPERVADAWVHGFWQATPLLVVLGFVGLFVMIRRDRAYAGFLMLIAVGVTGFAAAYEIGDWLLYCIPAWMALGVLAAAGTAALLERGNHVAAVTAVAVVLVLATATAQNFRDLRVVDNPDDIDRMLQLVADDGVVVVNVTGRQGTQLGYYYRYGQRLRKAESLDFVDVQSLLDTPALMLTRRPIYTARPRLSRRLSRAGIAQRELPLGGEQAGTYFASLPPTPVARIEYRRRADGSIDTMVGNLRFSAPAADHIVFAVVGGADGLRRGVMIIDIESTADWGRTLRQAVNVVRPGDWVVVLGAGLGRETSRRLGAMLQEAGVELAPIGGGTIDWVIGYRKRAPETPVLVVELADTLTVPIPLPTGAGDSRR